MEIKEEMQRIYNASKITDKAESKQNFALGLHLQGGAGFSLQIQRHPL